MSITPPNRKPKEVDETKEPTIVVFAPFTPKVVVTFDSIPVTKTAKRTIILRNPLDAPLNVALTKFIKEEYNATVDWVENCIPALSEIKFEMEWSPLREYSSVESIQFCDDRGSKKDVQIILKSIDKRPKKTLRPVPVKGNIIKKSPPKKLQSKKSPAVGIRRRSLSSSSLQTRRVKFSHVSPTVVNNRCRVLSIELELAVDNNEAENKENNVPLTPKNMMDLINKIQFTPLTETIPKTASNLDYLASLPTPTVNDNHNSVLNYTTSNILKTSNTSPLKSKSLMKPRPKNVFADCATPSILIKQFSPEIVSTALKSNGSEIPLNISFTTSHNKTFEVGDEKDKQLKLSSDNLSSDNLSSDTFVTSPHILDQIKPENIDVTKTLSMISEERNDQQTNTLDPFSINNSHENVGKNTTPYIPTPLRKIVSYHDLNGPNEKNPSTSFRYPQGSMPNLTQDQMLPSIENNRYFKKTFTTTEVKRNLTTNIIFQENEIRAQSSCYNLHEIKHSIDFDDLIEDVPENSEKQFSIPKYEKPVTITVTPPRREKYGSQNVNNSDRGRIIRVNSWNGMTQKKSIKPVENIVVKKNFSSISSILSSPTRSPRKLKFDSSEQRIEIYDQDMNFQVRFSIFYGY